MANHNYVKVKCLQCSFPQTSAPCLCPLPLPLAFAPCLCPLPRPVASAPLPLHPCLVPLPLPHCLVPLPQRLPWNPVWGSPRGFACEVCV